MHTLSSLFCWCHIYHHLAQLTCQQIPPPLRSGLHNSQVGSSSCHMWNLWHVRWMTMLQNHGMMRQGQGQMTCFELLWIVLSNGFGLGPKIRLLVWPSRTAWAILRSMHVGIMCMHQLYMIHCFAMLCPRTDRRTSFLHSCIPPLVLKHSCECR